MSESLEVQRVKEGPRAVPRMSLTDMQTLAKLFFESGMFKKDVASIAQAFVKIKAGEEFGMTPFVAMQSLNIIQGKVELNGDAQARMLKQSGKYDYRITEHNDQLCEITFFLGQKEIGVERFTMDDARRAGLLTNPTWQKFPRNMLFYRCLTNGCAFHAPDAVAFRIYGEGEISGEAPQEQVDIKTGEIIKMTLQPGSDPGSVRQVEVMPKTFTEKLKANAKPLPAQRIAEAIATREEKQMELIHPWEEIDEPEKPMAQNPEQKMFDQTLLEAKKLLRLIFDDKGKDRVVVLMQECFGRTINNLSGVELALRELSLGQLVDGVEALKQKRLEKR